MASDAPNSGNASVNRALSLIPVGLKEAALDSPTFRANILYFGEQIDTVERWLDNYARNTGKLAHETASLENALNNFLSSTFPPSQISEAALDHDYTLTAVKRYSEGAREFWNHILFVLKRLENTVIEPIRSFLLNDVRNLKEARRALDQAQKNFDSLISRFSGLSKFKELSSLREDAFQLHEARKAYLKASMDFCICAPQVKNGLDKLLVKIASEQWRDMKSQRDASNVPEAWRAEIERVKSWSKEMENGEMIFKRELFLARRQLEETAEMTARPSRELDEYALKAFPSIGVQAPLVASSNVPGRKVHELSEKQGWLFQRSVTGKPARSIWLRRWFFVKNGVFGCLILGARPGVEESEKISVLLCSIRAAPQEERRFCFEIKTKDTTILLQAETHRELVEWTAAFDNAKREALENPASTNLLSDASIHGSDAAFSVNPQPLPDPAASQPEENVYSNDDNAGVERAASLPVVDREAIGGLTVRGSFDVNAQRRTFTIEKEGESGRDHAARIIQKLDLNRKSTAAPQLAGSPNPALMVPGSNTNLVSPGGFILRTGQSELQLALTSDSKAGAGGSMPLSTLAPPTLANPPAPTSLSKAAVIVSGERGANISQAAGGIANGLMANLWGSKNWGYVNRLDSNLADFPSKGDLSVNSIDAASSNPTSAREETTNPNTEESSFPDTGSSSQRNLHQRSASVDAVTSLMDKQAATVPDYPRTYPLALKAQDAQFHILFPNISRSQKVVLVFRATWNPNDQQEFPGRVYVTMNDIFFYSNYLGLVLISAVSISAIVDVTAAPGKDRDFLFLHLKESPKQEGNSRVTIKTFLEPFRLLQRRISYLVQQVASGRPTGLEDVLKTFVQMEVDDPTISPSVQSWDDRALSPALTSQIARGGNDLRASLRIDGDLYEGSPESAIRKAAAKFKLPSQPVIYAPQGQSKLSLEQEYDISAKALFHVLFGDKSAIFQILYREREFKEVIQGPWVQVDKVKLRRTFEYKAQYQVLLARNHQMKVVNEQTIEVMNDHLCYVIADRGTQWHLPASDRFMAVTKFVITHVSKSRCKLGVYNQISWRQRPRIIGALIERAALFDLDLNALDVNSILKDEVSKLGKASNTRRAVQVFGHVGQQNQASHISAVELESSTRQRRLRLERRTLLRLLLSTLRHTVTLALYTFLTWLASMLSAVLNALSAHSFLVILLSTSAAFNLFYLSATASGWFQERNAVKVMSSLGASPKMGKAVYLRDLGEIWANKTTLSPESENACLATFQEILGRADIDTMGNEATLVSTTAPVKTLTTRLKRTRQNLASYRHDLLVAMRVVNNLEIEIVEAEWQKWVFDENRHCRRLGDMLSENRTDTSLRKGPDIESWYSEYCGSCHQAWELLESGDNILAFA